MTTPASDDPNHRPGDIASVGERGLIEHIRRRLPPPPSSLVVGIGDDAAVAVVDRGALQVLTTDALVEGVHFDRRFSSQADIGYKALAVNVSDIAAMGGTPRLALLSLMLPPGLPLADIDGLLDGLLEMAGATGVALAGGNIARTSGPLVVDVTVVGSVRPRRILTRSGGRAGDALFVSGTIGASAAGLGWLRAHGTLGSETPEDPALAECVARHRRPEPRARLGALLGGTKATRACMDSSDGLADAIRQLAESSGVGARIDARALPIHPGAAGWFSLAGLDPVQASLAGGEDYELLFTLSNRGRGRLRLVERQARGLRLTRIGELTKERGLIVERDGVSEPLAGGFAHF